MPNTTQSCLEFLQSVRGETLAMLGPLSQQQMDHTPAPGKWSIGEIADHLLLSEKLYRELIGQLIELAKAGKRPYIAVSVREVNFAPVGVPKAWLPALEIPFTMLNVFIPQFWREIMLRYAFLPGQNPDIAIPQNRRPAEDLRRELKASIQSTTKLFYANPGLDYTRMKMQHPLLGANNVPALLRLTALHEQRHQQQIKAIRGAAHFPAAA